VPVGEDQRQHLELTRNLAHRFNTSFGDTFTVPEPYIIRETAKIGDLQDPAAKMSKSASSPNGIIELLEEPARSAKKIRSAVTDTGREIIYAPDDKPGISNLLTIFSALSGRSIDDLTLGYEGKGYGDLKRDLSELVVEFVRPIQQRARGYLDDPAQLDKLLAVGAEKAGAVAAATLRTAYDRVGLLPRSRTDRPG
jgi:tryptophanyl-tRNA synthetase